ncbi:NACHT domain-containing protein [Cohnella suwonensis]|uniref:NACHT domain-containing protein n=1 Tax=Cohnella suwonensis TaxID=696072 RepID=A0ABW0LUR0_9BACL
MNIDFGSIASELVQNNIERIISVIYKKGSDQFNQLLIRSGAAYKKYLHESVKKYSRVKTILYRDSPVYLYDFYLDTNISINDHTYSASNMNGVLEHGHFINFIGSAGSGKSTLFKHLFLDTIKNTSYIPIMVELREINNRDQTLAECLFQSMCNLGFDLEYEYFSKSISSGRYVFLFDGFDEIDYQKRNEVSKQLLEMSDKFPDNYYLISARKNDQIFTGWNKFIDFEINPLEKIQALQLVSNLTYDPDIKDKFLAELEKKLFDEHTSFASNPLLLTIMLITYSQYAEIPDKIHLFYGQAFDALYSQHDATKSGYKRRMKTQLASDDFKSVVAAISISSYLDRVFSMTSDQLLSYLSQAKDLVDIDFNVDDFKADLVESVCLIMLDGLEYKYTHRSFQEYFAAKFIVSVNDEDQTDILRILSSKQISSFRVDNVLNLLFEMDKERFERNFIIPMIKEMISWLEDGATSQEEKYIRYIDSKFESFGISYIASGVEDEDEEDDEARRVVFMHRPSPANSYYEIVKFIFEKYIGIVQIGTELLPSYHQVDMIKKYGEEESDGMEFLVSTDRIRHDTELSKEFIGHASFILNRLNYVIALLPVLEQKHKDKKTIKELLFKIRSSN